MLAIHRRPVSLLLAAASITLLAGCASPGTTPAAAPTETSAPVSEFPLTIDNCGTEVTFAAPPERVITIKSTSTELLVALGLGDRIIGEAFPDNLLPEEIAGRETDPLTIELLSENVPGQEAVLGLEPDLVFAGWESNFGPDGAGERETLQSLGVATYVAPSACKAEDYQPEALTFETVFDHIREAGSIFDAEDAAEALITAQREVLEGITPPDDEVSVLWWSSGAETPYVGAGIGAPQMIMDAVGVTNIAADVDDTWTSMSWEAIIDANPDVIVLVDRELGTSVDRKLGVIRSNPATAQLDAVVNERFIVVPFAAAEAGARSADAAALIADQLRDLGY